MQNNDLLDELANMSLELSSLEDYDGVQDLENFVAKRYGARTLSMMQARKNQYKFGNPRGNVMQKPFLGGVNKPIDQNNAASFTLTAKRIGANITQSLPVPFFGVLEVDSAFQRVLNLGGGLSVAVVSLGAVNGTVANANKLTLNYSDGVNNDLVEITCAQNPYPSLLKATLIDEYQLSGIRYSISDTTKLQQFDENFSVKVRTLTGKSSEDSLTPSQFKDPSQFQNGIIDIKQAVRVDKETTIVSGLIPIDGFSIALNFFLSSLDKAQRM